MIPEPNKLAEVVIAFLAIPIIVVAAVLVVAIANS